MKKQKTYSEHSETTPLLVKEVMVQYGNIESQNIQSAYSANWESFFHTTQRGLLATEIDKLIAISPFKADFFCEALDISTKTLDRYKADKKRFNPNDSELVLKWKALFEQGKEVFDSYESFGQWLQKPSYGLNQILPKDLIKTSRGVDLVMEELMRIEWGQLS